MQNKKWIAVALVCGFIFGSGTSVAQASFLGKILKGGAIGAVVNATSENINDAINSITAKYGVSSEDATKVVPIIAVGDGSRAGAAQVSGPKSKVDLCKAALQIEQTVFGIRAVVLIPVDRLDVQNVKRVQGVGVSAQIDVKI
ncbi:MAG: hypothetical protein SPI71_03800 [Acidaminococcaceae bacterium]|nr:hypothetical protein [Acidaminococcaceae bacterium]